MELSNFVLFHLRTNSYFMCFGRKRFYVKRRLLSQGVYVILNKGSTQQLRLGAAGINRMFVFDKKCLLLHTLVKNNSLSY